MCFLFDRKVYATNRESSRNQGAKSQEMYYAPPYCKFLPYLSQYCYHVAYFFNKILNFYDPDQMTGGILVLPCLFVCLFVFLSVVNFNSRYISLKVKDRLHIWHACSINDALSNDTGVNNLALDLIFMLKLLLRTWLLPGALCFTICFVFLAIIRAHG